MDIIEKVKRFVESECKSPSSKYSYEPFCFHFIPVVQYAEELSKEYSGAREVVLLSAWLHDIGSIVYGRDKHHSTGAKIAEEKLTEFGYKAEQIQLVKRCILNHRGSIKNTPLSIEEQILIEADTMSAFDNIAGLFKAAFVYENLDQGQAREAVREKLRNKWEQLRFDSSKEIIKPKYEAAMLLLS